MSDERDSVLERLRLRIDDDGDDRHAAARRERQWGQLLVDLTSLTVELSASFVPIMPEHGEAASLCEGWSVADVVRHLGAGEDLALKALRGQAWPGSEPTSDDAVLAGLADRNVQALRSMSLRDAVWLWRDKRRELLNLCRQADAARAFDPVPWATGEISRFALVQSRLMETWVHGWDLRHPLGHETVFDDRGFWIVDLAVRTLPYALAKAGIDVPGLALTVTLAGPGGGTWNRTIGEPPHLDVSLSGDAWSFAAIAARRFGSDDELAHLVTTDEGNLFGELLIEHARAFA